MDWPDLLNLLLETSDINTIIGSVSGAIIAVIGAVAAAIKLINESRRKKGCDTHCITGKKLKPKKKDVKSKPKT